MRRECRKKSDTCGRKVVASALANQTAVMLVLEAWGHGHPQRREAVWMYVVNRYPLRKIAQELRVQRETVGVWVADFKAAAAHALGSVGLGDVEVMEEEGDQCGGATSVGGRSVGGKSE